MQVLYTFLDPPTGFADCFTSQQKIDDSLGDKQLSRCAECCHVDCELIKVSFSQSSTTPILDVVEKVQRTLESHYPALCISC